MVTKFVFRRSACVTAVLFFTPLYCGCGKAPELAPVSGTVRVNGQPVEDAQVLFMPRGKRPASGQTDENGHFVLSTFKKNDGAALGSHTVTIMYQRPIPYQPMPVPGQEVKSDPIPPPKPLPGDWKSPIPAKYSNPAAPILSAEVKEEENEFTFDLKG